MSPSNHQRGEQSDRLLDLMCDQATIGLSDAERAEFNALLSEFPELNDGSFERAAAAADLAYSLGAPVESMPAHLMRSIQAEGERIVAGMGRSSQSAGPLKFTTSRPARSDSLRMAGWLAAAAALVLAAIGWLRPAAPALTPDVIPPVAHTYPAQVRQQLLASATDAVLIKMADWDNPEQPGVTGDVVWSEAKQTGFLRLSGLKPNDPTIEQYQLWIVDSRGMGQRISGALFDAKPDPATGEVIVQIEPRIATLGAAAFALTIEPPGGVWVSDMTRRVVIGAKG
ncbi:MAG: anti-sigma factor [Phycisphaeraceae bacterium]|nr:anti-sigma factor [Phycisphaeraceae bacterium]